MPSLELPAISVNDLAVDHENSDVLYAATDIGVFRSNDAGYSWYFYRGSSDPPSPSSGGSFSGGPVLGLEG